MDKGANKLEFKKLGIDTQQEHVVFMHKDCPVCLSEGFDSLTRVRVSSEHNSIIATLNVVHSELLTMQEISVSERALKELGIREGDDLTVSHLDPLQSLSFVRKKIYGSSLLKEELFTIIEDIVKGRYSNVHLSSFITACSANNMSLEEIIWLTEAMIKTGKHIEWGHKLILDKHCVGGLPGNRTTPIIVAIIASMGLSIPKTSSRAITSPAGTADTMEVMTRVNLTLDEIREVVEKEKGCVVWGGIAGLSPADDIMIRVERSLDIDSEAQLIASVLSKKVAAGSSHVVIDIPVGETAKLRNIDAANKVKVMMEKVAHAIGLKLKVVITDGTQPVGRGIGPSLEARDVLAVLRNQKNAPSDLRERALLIAGELLELSGAVETGDGNEVAEELLNSGKAYEKFISICKAQGGFTEPEMAPFSHEIRSEKEGLVKTVDNRKLAKIAKLAGAPDDAKAGVDFYAKVGTQVKKGETLFVIYAESTGELNYALEYLKVQKDIITIA